MAGKVWFCKIGFASDFPYVVEGADCPMRRAVQDAYKNLTGKSAEFIFSGWDGELTEAEKNLVAHFLQ